MFQTHWPMDFILVSNKTINSTAPHNVRTHFMPYDNMFSTGLRMVHYEPKHVAFCVLINCMYVL
jgi:hypothetical protein